MARTISGAAQTAFSGWQGKFVLIELDLATGVERYAFSPIDIVWGGNTFLGIARPVEISEIRETDSGEAVGVQIQFKDINEAVIAAALTDNIRRRKVTMWVGAMSDALLIVVDPVIVFIGYGDQIRIQYNESQAAVAFSIETYEALWSRISGGRLTDQEHQGRYAGDLFFHAIADTVEQDVIWPSKAYWQ